MGTRTNINLLCFLDADMVVVLSKQPDAYEYYVALIREEYKYIPHDTYCKKRAKILECFLGSNEIEGSTARASPIASIFITGAVQEFFEAQAVANLRREINILQKGVIPGLSSGGDQYIGFLDGHDCLSDDISEYAMIFGGIQILGRNFLHNPS